MKRPLLLLCIIALASINRVFPQSWVVGGNNLSASASIGSNTNFSILFKTSNLTRGILKNTGSWGFGTTSPIAKVHINSVAGENPFLVGVAGATKLLFNSAGGLSIGSASNAPSNGLYVAGRAGIGTTAPGVKLQVAGGTHATLSGGGYFVAGSISANNLVVDESGIMARNNAAVAPLLLNANGGNLVYSGNQLNESRFGIHTSNPVADLTVLHSNGYFTHGLTLIDNFAPDLSWNFYTASAGDLWLSFNQNQIGTFDKNSGVYTTSSDKRLKKEIEPVENVLEKVMLLKPSRYRFATQSSADSRKYLGLIAQDIKPLFPEAVYEGSGKNDGAQDYMKLDYSVFGVVAIKAIQEQEQHITALEEKIEKLEKTLNAITGMAGGLRNEGYTKDISLEQNNPNPTNNSTIIRYRIPQGSTAKILLFSASGTLVKSLRATEANQLTLNAYELKPGSYTYALMVNGELAASKKLVIIK